MYKVIINLVCTFYLLPMFFILWYTAMQKIEDRNRADGEKAFQNNKTVKDVIIIALIPILNIISSVYIFKIVCGWLLSDIRKVIKKG